MKLCEEKEDKREEEEEEEEEEDKGKRFVCLLVSCLTSQQHASVPQGRTCSYNFTCCHTEMEVATGVTPPGKRSVVKAEMEHRTDALGADALPPGQPGGGA